MSSSLLGLSLNQEQTLVINPIRNKELGANFSDNPIRNKELGANLSNKPNKE